MLVEERVARNAEVLAAIRRDLAPVPGDPAAKLRICRRCGEPFWDWKTRNIRPCPDCTAINMESANLQRSRRAGPVYEQTVRTQLEFWLSEAKRLGIAPQGEQ